MQSNSRFRANKLRNEFNFQVLRARRIKKENIFVVENALKRSATASFITEKAKPAPQELNADLHA